MDEDWQWCQIQCNCKFWCILHPTQNTNFWLWHIFVILPAVKFVHWESNKTAKNMFSALVHFGHHKQKLTHFPNFWEISDAFELRRSGTIEDWRLREKMHGVATENRKEKERKGGKVKKCLFGTIKKDSFGKLAPNLPILVDFLMHLQVLPFNNMTYLKGNPNA